MARKVSWFKDNQWGIGYWSAQLLGWGIAVATGAVTLSLPAQAITFLAAFVGSTALATTAATVLMALSIVVLPSLLTYALTWGWFNSFPLEGKGISLGQDTLGWGWMTALVMPIALAFVVTSASLAWPVLLAISAAPFAMMLLRYVGGVMVSALYTNQKAPLESGAADKLWLVPLYDNPRGGQRVKLSDLEALDQQAFNTQYDQLYKTGEYKGVMAAMRKMPQFSSMTR